MNSFAAQLPAAERSEVQLSLDRFVVQHALHHRPLAVITSGGTAADLEQNSVRCLDNFSTGLRGAMAVEEFLQRGYAVIHVWRRGSAAPFARVVNEHVGLLQANFALDVASLGRLFAIAGENEDDDLVQSVLNEGYSDPWLSEVHPDDPYSSLNAASSNHSSVRNDRSDGVSLHRKLAYSTAIQKMLRERSTALSEGRLLTVPFRSVEEYLGKLQLCAEAVRDCQSLALFFLAAAVSDFYVPLEERSEHKIQSSSANGVADELVLRLKPVPKVISQLRKEWCPDAFVISFKLETDASILRHKANRAVERYGCHLVIGNLLHTRHKEVWILSPADQRDKNPSDATDWSFLEVTRSRSSIVHTASTSRSSTIMGDGSLESNIVDVVVQSHFEYISWHFHAANNNQNNTTNTSRSATTMTPGLKAAEKAQRLLQEKKRRVQRELFWKRARNWGLEIVGSIVAVGISYAINRALQRRLNG